MKLRRTSVIGAGAAVLLATLCGCGSRTEQDNARAQPAAQKASNNAAYDADNTARNANDANALTAGDQGESEADRAVTQDIRRGLMDDEALSVAAKNVKVITVAGKVTLRGPVKTEDERARIVVIAENVAGSDRVTNQLEVEQEKH